MDDTAALYLISLVVGLGVAGGFVWWLLRVQRQMRQPVRPTTDNRPQRRIRHYNPARRQRLYYQARIRRIQRDHALVMLALLQLLKEQEVTS
jgi:hypothetical protein